ncbi:MAG: PDZ domain-containing protein [bacterium]
MTGYFRFPTIHHDRIVFVSEDDLWSVPTSGGVARRLTSGLGEATRPFFSPDGKLLAYTATEDGTPEAYVMPSHGGPSTQLTYLGTSSFTTGWTADGQVVFRTNHRQSVSSRQTNLYTVSPEGGEPSPLAVGPANSCTFQPNGPGIALARNSDDLARWKRYKGGTAGVIWHTADGKTWKRWFEDSPAGHCRPMWIGDRVYFITDRDGYGNLWSCDLTGADLVKHTHHTEFYVRFASTDGTNIVYTAGGALYVFSPADGTDRAVEVDYASPQTQLNRRFVDPGMYLEDLALHPAGHSMAAIARGKLFNFAHWEGGVRQNGVEQGVRYRLPVWIDDTQILVISDEGGEERFEIHTADGSKAARVLCDDAAIGRPLEVGISPDHKTLVFANHRQELGTIDMATGALNILARSEYDRIAGFDFSADSRFLAYSFPNSFHTAQIRVANLVDGTVNDVTTGEFRDVEPVFDPSGRYLYFLSYRFFEPIYDQLFFEISFPSSMKPCLVTLRPDVDSPFVEKPRALDGGDDEKDDDEKDDEEDSSDETDESANDGEKPKIKEIPPVEIVFDGIQTRVQAFPAPVGDYTQLDATADRVFWTSMPMGTNDDDEDSPAPSYVGRVSYYSLKDYETKTFANAVGGFLLGPDRKTMALWGDSVRLVSAAGPGLMGEDDEDDRPSRKSGVVDFGRISIPVDTRSEWRQMLRESWRLMRDHYWSAELGGLDWDAVWARYSPLVDHAASRSEFSDIVWEMQGELATSHAYEFGGDYRRPPAYRPGFLGADIDWSDEAGAYIIRHIVSGDSWNLAESSPLARPGIDAKVGDAILAINGQRLGQHASVQQRLVNLAGQEVELVLQRGENEPHRITVRTLASEHPARYRQWVNTCRKRVHDATGGKIGYVHVPDMSAAGFAEFHRGFISEFKKSGLIVDVRANGGGHVSQLLLEKLARRNMGYDISRYGVPRSYPDESVHGPLVAVTDEHAGSDGDIFSHCFKLMNLDP